MDKQTVINTIGREWLTVIMRADSETETLKACEAAIAGGARLVEVTFSTENVCRIIRELRKRHGEDVILSAGTVRTVDQALAAIDAGADAIVSPNLYAPVVETAIKHGKVSMPGCVTPTEIEDALRLGADLIKLFPCYPFGPQYIGYVTAPLPEARIVPAGIVTLDNMKEYYDGGAFAAVAGLTTEMRMLAAVKAGRWSEVTAATKHWLERVKEIKP